MSEPRFTQLSLWGNPAKGEPLEWEWPRSRLAEARDYWVTTVSTGGRPASRPVWGVWLDDTVVLSVGSTTHWRNFRNNPQGSVHLPGTDEVVILEGRLRPDNDERLRARFIEVYNAKYEWHLTMETQEWVIVVEPSVVLAWVSGPTEDQFPIRSGRWEW